MQCQAPKRSTKGSNLKKTTVLYPSRRYYLWLRPWQIFLNFEFPALFPQVKSLESELDSMVEARDREKIRADKLDGEKNAWRTKMDQVEADLKHALRMADSKDSNLSKDMAMFNQEIARLTKERDTAKTELEVSRHDLARLERELGSTRAEADRLREDKERAASGMEKGQREIMESKDNEIRKLTERVGSLERDLDKLRFEKEALEKEKEQLIKQANDARTSSAASASSAAAVEEEEKRRLAAEKKIVELSDQIKVLKNELSDKQREYVAEKQDLQRVIEEMRKGGTEAANAEVEKLRRDLEKAQKEVKEGDIERERFQAQLEMLVQELEKKQVGALARRNTWVLDCRLFGRKSGIFA